MISNLDNISIDDLNTQISSLYKKLHIAMNTGNGHLCHQLRMAIETYQNKYQEKLKESSKQTGGIDFDSKINIK